MDTITADPSQHKQGLLSGLAKRQLLSYPGNGARIGYLTVTVLATVTLYYETFVGGSVSTLVLANLHMSFRFYLTVIALSLLIGAFGSLFAGITDRLGRANFLVAGLLVIGLFVAFVLPAAPNRWVFGVATVVVGLVEGVCLVASAALIRDFSPQVGRATAMGFWSSGPVVASLVVAGVARTTIPAIVHDPRFWTHEYRISGIVGLVVFVIAFIGLRELAPRLRDQRMVSTRDRALVEAKARGLSDADIAEAMKRPFRQLCKPGILLSALAVSLALLIYYTLNGLIVIYLTSVFGFSVKQANGLGVWAWGADAVAVIVFGLLSDRLRVRKPFMLAGGVGAAVMLVVFLLQAGHHPSYAALAAITAAMLFCLGITNPTWLASFTETVEARNPALIATGLAIWGWILRVIVSVALYIVPLVVTSATPGDTAAAWQRWYWVCVGGIVIFVLSIPLLQGRWRPRDARRDDADHQATVAAELARLEETSDHRPKETAEHE